MPVLTGKRVAILSENGFEEIELTSPKQALEEAGATVDIVSAQKGSIKAWNHDHWSIEIPVDVNLDEAKSEEYDALMIPGGVINPDQMRLHTNYIQFAEEFLEAGKPVAAICHGPQLLIETGMISGREMTSFPSIKTDLTNAGAIWQDKEVVTDNGLVTSRSPKDLPAFNKKMIEEIAEGTHESRSAFTQSHPVTQP
ncbi:MAG: type 1 glutamine amidotransferase domain-containing protein [Chitinophagaceae bacterium]